MGSAAVKGFEAREEDCGCECALLEASDRTGGIVGPIDPRVRLIACAVFAGVTVSLSHLPALLAAMGCAVILAALARLDARTALRRLASLDGFMLFVLVALPFTIPGETLYSIGGIPASRQGLTRAIEILLKSNAVVLAILALLGTMEPVDLGQTLGRLGVSDKFAQLFCLTVRYIDVMGQEYRRLRIAMKARAFRMGSNLHSWRSIGYLFGMLLVRSIERSERIVAAMRCRGFQGRFHTLAEPMPLGWRDHVAAFLSAIACITLVALENL